MVDKKLNALLEKVSTAQKQGYFSTLQLDPYYVLVLHGAIKLAMKHPETKKMKGAYPMLQHLRTALIKAMKDIGFSQEEIIYFENLEGP